MGRSAGEERATNGVDATKLQAFVDGAPNGRVDDGSVKKPDGTFVGVEIKSGTASRSAEQVVSEDRPLVHRPPRRRS